MIDFEISAKGKLSVYRSCPVCSSWLKKGSNLRSDRFLKQKQKVDGSWYHTSRAGRGLHKIAMVTLSKSFNPLSIKSR